MKNFKMIYYEPDASHYHALFENLNICGHRNVIRGYRRYYDFCKSKYVERFCHFMCDTDQIHARPLNHLSVTFKDIIEL